MSDSKDLELEMFQAIRLSELEYQKAEKEKKKRLNLLSFQLLDCLASVVIPKCSSCLKAGVKLRPEGSRRSCLHWYPEDLLPFWKLRSVCKDWQKKVEDWLQSRHVVLIYHQNVKNTENWKPSDWSILEDTWEIETVQTQRPIQDKFYIPRRTSIKKKLHMSNRWFFFLKHCELYNVRNNILQDYGPGFTPILDKEDAADRIRQLTIKKQKKDYRRITKAERLRINRNW